MAERLQTIIFDVERMCEEMSNGNFNVSSECVEAYCGDLENLYVSINNMNINVSNALSLICLNTSWAHDLSLNAVITRQPIHTINNP